MPREIVLCPNCGSNKSQLIDTDEFYCLNCKHQWKLNVEPIVPIKIEETVKVSEKVTIEHVYAAQRSCLIASACALCDIGNCTRRELLGDLALELNMSLEIIGCDKKRKG